MSTKEALRGAVSDLEYEVTKNTEAVRELTKALKDHDKPETEVKPTVDFLRRSLAAEQAKQPVNLHGFSENDRVVFIGSAHPRGLVGTVRASAAPYLKSARNISLAQGVPVVREDDGLRDAFPAKSTILEAALNRYVPKDPPKFYDAEPSGNAREWNVLMARAAVEEGLTVRFLYRKPYAFDSANRPEERTLSVKRFIENPTPERGTIEGLDGTEYRSFRMDHIDSYIRKV